MELLREYNGFGFNSGKKDIDGAALVRLVAKAAERRAKAALLSEQEPEREEKPEPKWQRVIGWTLIGMFSVYILAHVIVAAVR